MMHGTRVLTNVSLRSNTFKGDNSEHYKIDHINKSFEMLYTKNHRTPLYENYSAS